MGKFCASCGSSLNEGAKFCAKCGANASPVSEEAGALSNQATPNSETVLSEVKEKVKPEVKMSEATHVKSVFTSATPAYQMIGELTLPSELVPTMGDMPGEGLWSLLKNGFRGLAASFKRSLHDKKRLSIVIALATVWLVVNILAALDIFPLPIRVLSWMTAARGSLIGGSIGKGLVAALFAQIFTNKGMLPSIKGGISKLTAAIKGGKKTVAPLMMSMSAALIVCNMMASSNLQNTMVCIAGFALSAKALTQNGFLRRLTSAILPKAKDATITAIMGGWTLGFAVFAAVSLLPGGGNGYWSGLLLVVAGVILLVVNKNKKEGNIQ